MPSRVEKRIISLLNAIKADHPRRRNEAQQAMKRTGVDGDVNLLIGDPAEADCLPTFNKRIFHAATPMLKARFDYAGSWQDGDVIWPSTGEMASYMKRRWIRAAHRGLRENYEGSAPMLFDDGRLTLFGTTTFASQDITYLVWTKDDGEPEIWDYALSTYDFHQFVNLEEYLRWCLDRP